MAAPDEIAGLEARFWPKVDKRAADECWRWTGATSGQGYGYIRIARRCVFAHRTSWALSVGLTHFGLGVLHTCDNPPCVNPAHLFLGTNTDNMRDKTAKGRQAAGSRHGCAKLSEFDVAEIRRLDSSRAIARRDLAARYGVTKEAISYIVRCGWRHVS